MSSWVTIGQKCRVSMSHSVYCRNKRSKSDLLSTGMMVHGAAWWVVPETGMGIALCDHENRLLIRIVGETLRYGR